VVRRVPHHAEVGPTSAYEVRSWTPLEAVEVAWAKFQSEPSLGGSPEPGDLEDPAVRDAVLRAFRAVRTVLGGCRARGDSDAEPGGLTSPLDAPDSRRPPTNDTPISHWTLARSDRTFGMVVKLCRLGYDQQASMPNRSLFEDMISAHFAALRPASANRLMACSWPCFAACTLAASALVVHERQVQRRGGDPLLDLGLLRTPRVAVGVIAVLLVMSCYAGFLVSLTLHLQGGLGFTPCTRVRPSRSTPAALRQRASP
jgi:hypothetical protein